MRIRKVKKRTIAVFLSLVLALASIVSLLVLKSENTLAAPPGTGPYYAERRNDAFEKVGWVQPGTPCITSTGTPTTTIATATIPNFTYGAETIQGIPTTGPGSALHGGGPWELNLSHTAGKTAGCSMPWNGNSTAPPANQTVSGAAYNITTNPYLVYTAEEYRYCVLNHASFRLMKDIDLGGYLGRNWTTPAAASVAWTADGNGHTVYNYYRHARASLDFNVAGSATGQSMFGPANGITIKNLRASNAYAYAADALANPNGTVRGLGLFLTYDGTGTCTVLNCAAEKSVLYLESTNENRGYGASTFVVSSNNATVDKCYANDVHIFVFSTSRASCASQILFSGTGTVTNTFSINGTVIGNRGHNGGFVSCMSGLSTIRNCFSDVEIYGYQDAGAFVGVQHGNASTKHVIENCFSTGKVEGVEALGGFMGSPDAYANSGIASSEIKNAYSTAMVGMMSNARKQGSFLGSWKGVVNNTNNSARNYTITDCYGAGEVGSLDMDSTLGRGNSTSAGFTGAHYYDAATSNTIKYTNCYYDKQTTGMKEWALGCPTDGTETDTYGTIPTPFPGTPSPGYTSDTCQTMGANWNVKGVLTTDTNKSGTGLTSPPSSHAAADGKTDQSFTGFTNNNDWVFEAGHYPQLKVFAQPTTFTNTNWMTQTEMNNLVIAYSRASTSTVMFDTYDEDHNGNTLNRPANPDVYDTVRDITHDFTMTSASDTKWARVGNGPTLANGKGNTSSVPAQGTSPVVELNHPIPIYGEDYQTTGLSPGIEWLRPTVLRGTQEGTRALRTVPLSRLYATPSETVALGDLYDHKPSVKFAFTTGPEYNAGLPILHAEAFPGTTQYEDVPAPIVAGSKVSYIIRLVTGTNPDGSYTYGPPMDLSDDSINHQFNGLAPFILPEGIYAITYVWEFSDKRFMVTTKYVCHTKTISGEKHAFVNGIPRDGSDTLYETVSIGDTIRYELTVNNLGFEIKPVPSFLSPVVGGSLGMTMSNSIGAGAALVNEVVTFTIALQNNSSAGTMHDMDISSAIPIGMDFVEGSIEINGQPAGVNGYINHSTGLVHGLISSLAAGATSTITYQAKVNGVFIASNMKYATQAQAVYSDAGGLVTNQCSLPTEFDIAGQSGALIDILPAGLTYVSHNAAVVGETFSRNGQECRWDFPSLPVGQTTVSVTVRVDNSGNFVNTATLEDSLYSPNGQPTNNTYHHCESTALMLHLRQVVVDYTGDTQLPYMGFFNLRNSGVMRQVTTESNKHGLNVDFRAFVLPEPDTDMVYLINDILPQYYEYAGFVATGANAAHNPASMLTTAAQVNFAGGNEFWVTVYIRPRSDPGKHVWDFKTNSFGTIYETPPSPDDPYPVGRPLYFFSQTTSGKTQLYFIENVGNGTGDLIKIGNPVNMGYNAMGFRTADMYLYAMKNSSNMLVRIGRGGAVTEVGLVSNLPSQHYDAGTFGTGAYSDILFLQCPSDTVTTRPTRFIYMVNVATMSATRLTMNDGTNNIEIGAVADLFFMRGYLWAVRGTLQKIYRINIDTGRVREYALPNPGIITAQTYGGQWLYSEEDFGLLGNGDGKIHRVHINNPTASPTFTRVATIQAPQNATGNDAASYIGLVSGGDDNY